MGRRSYLGTCRTALSVLLLGSALLLLYGMAWDYSTREYLEGFSDAIVPLDASPQQKTNAILEWMTQQSAPQPDAHGLQAAAVTSSPNNSAYGQLLRNFGDPASIFVDLAESAGLPARRLILLDQDRRAKRALAEVRLEGRWVVVDPSFGVLLCDAQGKPLTRQELADPLKLLEATNRLRTLPGWDDRLSWLSMPNRPSKVLTLAAALLLCFTVAGRIALTRYGQRHPTRPGRPLLQAPLLPVPGHPPSSNDPSEAACRDALRPPV